MRWHTGTTHTSEIPPKVTIQKYGNPTIAAEIKIDFRGLGVYLSKQEASDLAMAIDHALFNDQLANGEPDER